MEAPARPEGHFIVGLTLIPWLSTILFGAFRWERHQRRRVKPSLLLETTVGTISTPFRGMREASAYV